MDSGVLGILVGPVLGFVGGLVGGYFSIKNTNGPRERTFMIKCGVICWMAVLLFLALLFMLPHPYRWFLWVPYGIFLPLGISYGNKRQQKIREQEANQHAADLKQH